MHAIFEMTLRRSEGDCLTLSSGDFTLQDGSWIYAPLGLRARLQAAPHGEQLVVAGDGLCVVEQVRYPICVQEHSSQYDQLLFASSWGDNLHEPTQTIRRYWEGRNQRSDAYQYIKCAPNEIRYLYPSIMAMQFVTLYNGASSFYLASYSTGSDSLSFCARALSGPCALDLSILHYPWLESGEWTSPACESAVLGAGWHPACDLYMSRMGGVFADPDWPAWMKSPDDGFHGWVQVPMKYRGRPALLRYSDLPRVYREKVASLGLNTMHVFGWCNEGHDTLYSDYYPNPELGTPQELRAACEEIIAMGGHVILYANGRLYSLKSRLGQKYGDSIACKDENGVPYDEIWGPNEHFRICCPTETPFHDETCETIRRFIAEYGANAAQLDQISCNYGEFCYDKTHHHPTPASNFLPGVERELIEARKVHKALRDDFFVWAEGCHERFGQYYDVEQGHGETYSWQVGESLPEQFRYCRKDRIVTGLARNIHQLCHSMLQGKPFDITLASLQDSAFAAFLGDMIRLRRHYPQFYLTGRFMDTAGLQTDRSTRCAGLLSQDGSQTAVGLWRRGSGLTDASCTWLRLPAGSGAPECIYPADGSIRADGSWLEVSFTGPLAIVTFATKNQHRA